jgi:hemerythrin-like domain-containing protein
VVNRSDKLPDGVGLVLNAVDHRAPSSLLRCNNAWDKLHAPTRRSIDMATATTRRDILKTLRSEHDTLRTLFDQINDTTDRAKKTRTELLTSFEGNLLPHARWEEDVFYPALRERADHDGKKAIAEAYLEHHAVESVVMPEVKANATDTPGFAGAAKVFGEQIDHHASEEESTVFKLARELFTPTELAQFDEQYEEWKTSASGALAVGAEKLKGAVKTAGSVLS